VDLRFYFGVLEEVAALVELVLARLGISRREAARASIGRGERTGGFGDGHDRHDRRLLSRAIDDLDAMRRFERALRRRERRLERVLRRRRFATVQESKMPMVA
jgi:hypothetical protein